MINYHDVTDSADPRVDYPEYVDGFLRLGFVQVGRILAQRTDLSAEEIADQHGIRRDIVLGHLTTPASVLLAPDTPAFVEISWFFGSPSIHICTQLVDGFLIETLRRWDNAPWDKPTGDIDKLMLRNHAPDHDRSTRVVSSSSCAELWASHLEHIAELRQQREVSVSPHADLSDYVAVSKAAFDRDRPYWHRSIERFLAGQNRPEHEVPKMLAATIRDSMLVALLGVVIVVAAVWLFQTGM